MSLTQNWPRPVLKRRRSNPRGYLASGIDNLQDVGDGYQSLGFCFASLPGLEPSVHPDDEADVVTMGVRAGNGMLVLLGGVALEFQL